MRIIATDFGMLADEYCMTPELEALHRKGVAYLASCDAHWEENSQAEMRARQELQTIKLLQKMSKYQLARLDGRGILESLSIHLGFQDF